MPEAQDISCPLYSPENKTVKHQISINKLQVNFAPHIVGAQYVQSHKI